MIYHINHIKSSLKDHWDANQQTTIESWSNPDSHDIILTTTKGVSVVAKAHVHAFIKDALFNLRSTLTFIISLLTIHNSS